MNREILPAGLRIGSVPRGALAMPSLPRAKPAPEFMPLTEGHFDGLAAAAEREREELRRMLAELLGEPAAG